MEGRGWIYFDKAFECAEAAVGWVKKGHNWLSNAASCDEIIAGGGVVEQFCSSMVSNVAFIQVGHHEHGFRQIHHLIDSIAFRTVGQVQPFCGVHIWMEQTALKYDLLLPWIDKSLQ